MKQPQYSPGRGEVLDTTDARQASPRKDNLRVLIFSLVIALVLGVALVFGFWKTTPTAMDYSSGGKLQESQSPASTPSTTTEPGAAPSATTPPPNPPTPPTP